MFDGDEMNIHVCQSYLTKAEVAMASPDPISAQASKPIICIVQDCLNGAYIMTSNDCGDSDSHYSIFYEGGDAISPFSPNVYPPFSTRNKENLFKQLQYHPHIPSSYVYNLKNLLDSDVRQIKIVKSGNILEAYEYKKLTSDRTNVITKFQFMDLSLAGKNLDGSPLWNNKKMYDIASVFAKKKCKKSIYGGHALFSLILPRTLNYEMMNNANPIEPVVKIYHGVLYEGTLDKTILGAAHNSLIQVINKEYGKQQVYNFIDNVHFVVNSYLRYKGFSIGLADCLLSSSDGEQSSLDTIKSIIAGCFTQAKSVEDVTINAGIREVRVSAALNKAKDAGLKIAKENMRKDNNFLIPIRSGSKGDYFNIAQITGLLGQQNMGGERIKYVFNNCTRSLPHYPRGGMPKHIEYESRGFISNSFIGGLTPEEFYYHADTGREGVTDTAIKTAMSGYDQRRMVKLTEDITSQYDGTVRDRSGSVYQMLYWGNGLNPQHTVKTNTGRGHEQFFCDVGRLASMLNAKYENNILQRFRDIVKSVRIKLRVVKMLKKNHSPVETEKVLPVVKKGKKNK